MPPGHGFRQTTECRNFLGLCLQPASHWLRGLPTDKAGQKDKSFNLGCPSPAPVVEILRWGRVSRKQPEFSRNWSHVCRSVGHRDPQTAHLPGLAPNTCKVTSTFLLLAHGKFYLGRIPKTLWKTPSVMAWSRQRNCKSHFTYGKG